MRDHEFDALAKLLRMKSGPAREAARLVLVHRFKVGEAAWATGASQPSVSNAVARCKRGIALVRIAAGKSISSAMCNGFRRV
jgi:predicted DNA-binding protein (UPF0251 family)